VIVKDIQKRTDVGQTIAPDRISRLAKLAESTKKQKIRKGLPTRSRLRETGEMIDSIRAKTNQRTQSIIIEPTGSKNQEKAIFAHEGSSNRPERPFIPETLYPRLMNRVLNILAGDLFKKIRSK
jgi:hypothetical protein